MGSAQLGDLGPEDVSQEHQLGEGGTQLHTDEIDEATNDGYDEPSTQALGFSPWRDRTATASGNAVILEALNVTSLDTAFDNLVGQDSAMLITEHAMPVKYHAAWKRRSRAKGYVLHMGPTDPEAADEHRAGVGFMAPLDFCATSMPALTDTLRRAVALGKGLPC
ncbi:MAG: hypothetical protein ACKPKO_22760, partial [Candidatus Fonsibacter sp.]